MSILAKNVNGSKYIKSWLQIQIDSNCSKRDTNGQKRRGKNWVTNIYVLLHFWLQLQQMFYLDRVLKWGFLCNANLYFWNQHILRYERLQIISSLRGLGNTNWIQFFSTRKIKRRQFFFVPTHAMGWKFAFFAILVFVEKKIRIFTTRCDWTFFLQKNFSQGGKSDLSGSF